MARWYRRAGFEIVARNWMVRGGELDVVARRGNLVVVCEVKARADDRFGSAAEALTPVKQARVRRTAAAFLRELGESGLEIRFDLACVTGTDLEVWPDAF